MEQLPVIGATVAGALMIVLAGVGCIVPVIPGPLLAAGALALLSAVTGWSTYSATTLIVWIAASVIVQILDNVLPARAASRAGAGPAGVWGSVIGMLVGSIFFPPFGTFIGAFAGALGGELLLHRDNRDPVKSALAVFRGTMGAIVLKLAVTGGIAFVFVRGVVRALGA